MNKTLQAFEQSVRERNRRESEPITRTSKTWAPTAPPSEDPMTCRWCGFHLIVLPDTARTVYCPGTRCSQDLLFRCWCETCRRHFESGNPKADICWQCDSTEKAEIERAVSKHGPASMGRRGSRNFRG